MEAERKRSTAAQMIEVLQVVTLEGVISYYAKDGTLLAVNDPAEKLETGKQ